MAKKLTQEQIEKKRDYKLQQITNNKKRETQRKIEERKTKLHERTELEMERKRNQLIRKENAYINRKTIEYSRKCKNEIRKLQGKEERVYKIKPLTRNQKLQFALSISQENSKLRDTNKDGYGFCITCKKRCSRKELAGGHGASRTIQGACLRESNINAQCHDCNYAMGPEGNTNKRMKTEMMYRMNARKKRGDEEINELLERVEKSVKNPNKYAPSVPYLDDLIPELIKKNEELRKTKSFYSPGKNRRKIYEKYRNLSNNQI